MIKSLQFLLSFKILLQWLCQHSGGKLLLTQMWYIICLGYYRHQIILTTHNINWHLLFHSFRCGMYIEYIILQWLWMHSCININSSLFIFLYNKLIRQSDKSAKGELNNEWFECFDLKMSLMCNLNFSLYMPEQLQRPSLAIRPKITFSHRLALGNRCLLINWIPFWTLLS